MADTELKLEQLCPWCGTSNASAAQRCSHCLQDLHERPDAADPSVAALFERGPAVGFSQRLGGTDPFAASLPLAENPAPSPISPLSGAPRRPSRARRRPDLLAGLGAGLGGGNGVTRLVFFARLVSVLFLFWGVLDTSTWLTRVTAGLPSSDIGAVRYSIFAVYEVLRDLALVAGVWLLTLLRPKSAS